MFKGSYSQIKSTSLTLLSLHKPIVILGKPGCGKTHLVRDLAHTLSAYYNEVNIPGQLPPDIRGYLLPQEGKAVWTPPAFFQFEADGSPTPNVLYNLEEFNAGMKDCFPPLYQFFLEGRIGQHQIHPSSYICATGNTSDCGAITTAHGTALATRVAWFELEENLKDFLSWYQRHNFDASIPAFLRIKSDGEVSEFLHKSNRTGQSFPCPRSWANLGEALASKKFNNSEVYALATAYLGQEAALMFMTIYELRRELNIDWDNPAVFSCAGLSPTLMWVIGSLCIDKVNDLNFEKVCQIACMLPAEFARFAITGIKNKSTVYLNCNAISTWLHDNQDLLV